MPQMYYKTSGGTLVPIGGSVNDTSKVSLTGTETISGAKTFSSGITVTADSSITGDLTLPTSSGSYRGINLGSGTGRRWFIGKHNGAESGSNAGSDFIIWAYDDSGNQTYKPVTIERGTGRVYLYEGRLDVVGTASRSPVITVSAPSGQSPYLILNAVGANDGFFGWSTSNVTRMYFRMTSTDFSIRMADDAGSIWGSAPYGNVFQITRATGRVTLGGHTSNVYNAGLELGGGGARIMSGTGSPEGVITAPAGSRWTQTDGEGATWRKTGSSSTGWKTEFGLRFQQLGTTTYTFVLADAGRMVEYNGNGNGTLTIPKNVFPLGTQITVVNATSSTLIINTADSATMNLNGNPQYAADQVKLRGIWSACTLFHRFSNEWIAMGDLST